MDAGLIKFLRANVTAVDGRVFLSVAPQGTATPYLVVQRVSTLRIYAFSSTSTMAGPLFQISCWATTAGGAIDLAKDVHAALLLVTGDLVTASDDDDPEDPELTFPVLSVMAVSEGDDMDDGLYRRRLDYRIWHLEDLKGASQNGNDQGGIDNG